MLLSINVVLANSPTTGNTRFAKEENYKSTYFRIYPNVKKTKYFLERSLRDRSIFLADKWLIPDNLTFNVETGDSEFE